MEETYFVELSKRTDHAVWTETILLLFINTTAFFGSLLVFIAVYRNQSLRTLTNMFVVALAVSDILISICCMPLTIATLIRGRWIFSANVCRFQGFAMFTLAMVSLLTMEIIAINRYFCVVNPQTFIVLFNRRRIFMYIVVVWCAALVGSVPPIFFEKGGYKFQPGKAMCMYTFDTNIAYTVFIECVYISSPLILITFCYVRVFYTVSRTNQVFSHENNPQQLQANVEESKVTKTVAAVMTGFAFCWLPICIMDYIDAARERPTLPRQAYLTYGFLAYLSSVTNPVIYGVMNRNFRREYKAILKKVICLQSYPCTEITPEVSGSENRRARDVGTSSVWWEKKYIVFVF